MLPKWRRYQQDWIKVLTPATFLSREYCLPSNVCNASQSWTYPACSHSQLSKLIVLRSLYYSKANTKNIWSYGGRKTCGGRTNVVKWQHALEKVIPGARWGQAGRVRTMAVWCYMAIREEKAHHISKLQPEGVLCKHVRFLCFADGIHLKHMYFSCVTLRSMCLNTCEKTKSPRGFCLLFHLSQRGCSPECPCYFTVCPRDNSLARHIK